MPERCQHDVPLSQNSEEEWQP